MTLGNEQTSPERPLLILISDSPRLDAEVRSRDRDVRRWHDGVGHAPEQSWFEGDPGSVDTYEWTRQAPVVSAVIDLHPPDRARAALHALRRVRPDAAVLLLSAHVADEDGPADGTVARAGRLRDVLRVDLEEELERLEAERRAFCLRQFAAAAGVVPILVHRDPDPDAVSSALAVATLLGGDLQRTPIVTLQQITRPENRRMVDVLRIGVTEVTEEELRRFDRLIAVDMQPVGLQVDGRPRLAVIDHHPHEQIENVEFRDVRPHYGATATMLTEYLRATDPRLVHEGLATALLFGIKTDTGSLTRGVTSADVNAYGWLQEIADEQLVRRFEKPSFAIDTARAYGRALASIDCDDGLCVAYVGELQEDQTHVLADLADFCLGIEQVTWVVVAGVVEGGLVMTLRHTGAGVGAGAVARALAGDGGSGGGHASMARVTLPVDAAQQVLSAKEKAPEIRRLVREAMQSVPAQSPNRRDSRPTRQVSAPARSSR